MVFVETMKNMKIYKQPCFLPTVEGNKKKDSAVILLTPNYESSKSLMNNPLFINKKRYESYFLDRDVSYYIGNKKLEEVDEAFLYFEETKRSNLKDSDFGIPEDRKFPLDTEEHVRSAIKLFGHAEESKKKALAKKISRRATHYGIEIPDTTQCYKYLHEDVFEENPHVKNIVFDLGSVLVRESTDEEVFHLLCGMVPINVIHNIRYYSERMWGNGDFENATFEEEVEYLKSQVTDMELPYVETVYKYIILSVKPFDYTEDLLRLLKTKGYNLYYLSNWNQASFEMLLEDHTFDFLRFFNGGLVSWETGTGKPDPEFYAMLIKKYNLDPSTCIFFDDRMENVDAANNVGMIGCLFDYTSTYKALMQNIVQEVFQPAEEDDNLEFIFSSPEKDIIDIKFEMDEKEKRWNSVVLVEGVAPKTLRGRSECIVIKDDMIFLDETESGICSKGGIAKIKYDVPGGGWDPNEPHDICAIRETQEEAKIDVKDVQYIDNYLSIDKVRPEGCYCDGLYSKVYIGKYAGKYTGPVADVDRADIAVSGNWYKIDEVYDLLNPIHKKAIDIYFGRESQLVEFEHPLDESVSLSGINIKPNKSVEEAPLSQDQINKAKKLCIKTFNSLYGKFIDDLSKEFDISKSKLKSDIYLKSKLAFLSYYKSSKDDTYELMFDNYYTIIISLGSKSLFKTDEYLDTCDLYFTFSFFMEDGKIKVFKNHTMFDYSSAELNESALDESANDNITEFIKIDCKYTDRLNRDLSRIAKKYKSTTKHITLKFVTLEELLPLFPSDEYDPEYLFGTVPEHLGGTTVFMLNEDEYDGRYGSYYNIILHECIHALLEGTNIPHEYHESICLYDSGQYDEIGYKISDTHPYKRYIDQVKDGTIIRQFVDKESVSEACKDLSTARKFVSDVQKLAKDYDANFFIVTDGASGYSNGNGKSNPAVKNARNSQIEWEKKHDFDPDEDWSSNVKESYFYISESLQKSELDSNFKKKSISDINYEVIDFHSPKAKKYIENDSYLSNLYNKNQLKDFDGELIGDKDTNEVIGRVFIGTGKDKGYIGALRVYDKYKGYGFGDILIKDAINKYGGYDLNVFKDNEVALKMYKKYGFEVSDEDSSDSSYYMKLKSKINEATNNSDETFTMIEDFNKELHTWSSGVLINGKVIKKKDVKDWGGDVDWTKYKTIPIKQMDKYHVGVCWDFVNYEYNWFKEHNIPAEAYLFVMQRSDDPDDIVTHTFLLFKYKGKKYWFESSWYGKSMIKEVRGFEEVCDTLVEVFGNHSYSVYRYSPEGLDKNLTNGDFFKKATKTLVKDVPVDEAYDSIEEGTIISKKDAEFNLSSWKPNGKNILFITGLSGSGKSTKAAKLAKEKDAVNIELDLVEHNEILFDDSVTQDEGNQILKEFFEKKFGGPKKLESKSMDVPQVMYEAIKYCMKYADDHKDKLFIAEGIQLMDLEMVDELKGYPVIVVNTSVAKSIMQAKKREEGASWKEFFGSWQSFKEYCKWYFNMEKNKNKFIKDMKESYDSLEEGTEFILET